MDTMPSQTTGPGPGGRIAGKYCTVSTLDSQ